jgi:flagellar biosynthesis/type III secretory pathway chaperone
MDPQRLIELGQKEISTLKEFLCVLDAERESIISFSLDGIVRENNRKEEVLKRLEYLEVEKDKISLSASDRAALAEMEAWTAMSEEMQKNVREVRTALEKNMRLLSFSTDHVKSSLERVIGYINRSSYEKGRSISVMVSREV